jgi:hypothetical protein
MRTGMKWALPAVLALILAAPTLAVDPPVAPARNPDVGVQLQMILNDLAVLREEVKALRRDVTSMAVQGASASVDLRALRERLDALEAAVGRQDDMVRRAFSYTPSAAPPPPATAPALGTIVLRNFSGVTGTFYLNGRPYVVAPGARVNVERMPAGTFNYEISADFFGTLRPLTTRVLNPGQTFYLNIDPS